MQSSAQSWSRRYTRLQWACSSCWRSRARASFGSTFISLAWRALHVLPFSNRGFSPFNFSHSISLQKHTFKLFVRSGLSLCVPACSS
ncbi:hypothetical protein I3842_08G162300 [Carya illinoinensis]|uniref:Uncharacterized protein n=1 Tax=Carya illinoinensis TaxID=32201 RepID=A0A922JEF4_CARIL|nr:hypothetical protein I3842_08G162300 [Carya illinoinensis]